jgi:hypothetical protein
VLVNLGLSLVNGWVSYIQVEKVFWMMGSVFLGEFFFFQMKKEEESHLKGILCHFSNLNN